MDAAAQSAAWLPEIVTELYKRSGGQRFGLSASEFGECLQQVCAKYLPTTASQNQIKEFLTALRLEDLALARACARGYEPAWTEFLNRYRAPLYDAAYAIARDEATGRELADSLYAELYGIHAPEEQRLSKLHYYSGRGSLLGWLRSVLAQEFVDRFRRQRRLVSLEEQIEAGAQFAAAAEPQPGAADPRLISATDAALAELDSESRYLLSAYFLDQRPLAAIARSLAVHESTISRKLQRVITRLRRQIVKQLQAAGLNSRAAKEALDVDVRDLTVDVRTRLRPPPKAELERSSES
jgi:RNA polymerase sigma-70 factor (ECF subfamily)